MKGDAIYLTKQDARILQDVIRKARGGFTSRRPVPVRRRPMGGGGSAFVATDCALLFKDMPAATFSVSIGDPITSTTASASPSALVEAAVVPLAMASTEDPQPTDDLVHTTNDDEETIVYDAVNACWLTEIKAGDGQEQTSGEPPEGTGFYNSPPVMVYGFVRDYSEPGETEEDPPVQKKYFVITDILNPCIVYEATLDAALSSGSATVEVSPTEDIWGKRPTGTRTAENVLEWEAESGAKAYILRGYERDVILNVECPPPEEE